MAIIEPKDSFRLQLLKPEKLLSNRSLLLKVNALINEAYDAQPRLPPELEPFHEKTRLKSEDQLVRELGPEGLIALLFDNDLAENEGKYGQLVAIGCIKPWKGRVIEAFMNGTLVDGERMSETYQEAVTSPVPTSCSWDWELTSCASVDDPRYRRKGMVSRCIEALRQELIKEREEKRSVAIETSDMKPIKFWISAHVGVGNQEYWTRRGYKLEGPIETAPKGVWGAKREFQIATMSKVVA